MCDYGNGNFTEEGIDFWNYGAFAIAPKNQLVKTILIFQMQEKRLRNRY